MFCSFHWHCWRRDVSNFALLKHREFDGFIVTMQHSGTHWLKYMLSVALAAELELPPPQYIDNNSSNDLIGHPKHPRRYPHAPRLASSHSIPHAVFDSRLLRMAVSVPPYAVLVRDLRDALVSNYEKWKTRYGVSFSEYLRGDPSGRRYIMDIWNGLHFMNRWGRVQQRFPRATLVLSYEQLERDPGTALAAVFEHFGISVAPHNLSVAVEAGSKQNMAQRLNPELALPSIVRTAPTSATSWFNDDDRAFFDATVARYLRHDFGYAFNW